MTFLFFLPSIYRREVREQRKPWRIWKLQMSWKQTQSLRKLWTLQRQSKSRGQCLTGRYEEQASKAPFLSFSYSLSLSCWKTKKTDTLFLISFWLLTSFCFGATFCYHRFPPFFWLIKGGEHAHELSGLVSNRRTPSGNFLNKSNPSLWSKTKPESDYSKSGSLRESITLEALRTIRKSPKK